MERTAREPRVARDRRNSGGGGAEVRRGKQLESGYKKAGDGGGDVNGVMATQ